MDNLRAEIQHSKNLYRRELDWMRRQPQARGHKAKYREDAFYELAATSDGLPPRNWLSSLRKRMIP